MKSTTPLTRGAFLCLPLACLLALAGCGIWPSSVEQPPKVDHSKDTYPFLRVQRPYDTSMLSNSYVMDGTILTAMLSSSTIPLNILGSVLPTKSYNSDTLEDYVYGAVRQEIVENPTIRHSLELLWSEGGIKAYSRYFDKLGDDPRAERSAVFAESDFAELLPLRVLLDEEIWYEGVPKYKDLEVLARVRRRVYLKECEVYGLIALCEVHLEPIWKALRELRFNVPESTPAYMGLAVLETSSLSRRAGGPWRFGVIAAFGYDNSGTPIENAKIGNESRATDNIGSARVVLRETLVGDIMTRTYAIPGAAGEGVAWPLLPKMDWEKVMPKIRTAAAHARYQF